MLSFSFFKGEGMTVGGRVHNKGKEKEADYYSNIFTTL